MACLAWLARLSLLAFASLRAVQAKVRVVVMAGVAQAESAVLRFAFWMRACALNVRSTAATLGLSWSSHDGGWMHGWEGFPSRVSSHTHGWHPSVSAGRRVAHTPQRASG